MSNRVFILTMTGHQLKYEIIENYISNSYKFIYCVSSAFPSENTIIMQ